MHKDKEINPQFITDEQGNKTFVILSIEDYNALMEDIEDLAEVAERREEPTIAHAELLRELKRRI